MITVEEADKIILSTIRDYGSEIVPLEKATGRILAEELGADRDSPPFNRVTMDGIAINYQAFKNNIRTFRIKAVQRAGEQPSPAVQIDECIEIMTGAALPEMIDTVVRYEDVEISGGMAKILTDQISAGQNIHFKGKDKKKGELILSTGDVLSPDLIAIAASIGAGKLRVRKLPRILVLSTGDELVDIDQNPSPYQIRKSNSYLIRAALLSFSICADLLHLPDDKEITTRELQRSIANYDVIILSGGVSMGKFDYVPGVLEELNITKRIHRVQQRPGKPFWFGNNEHTLIFAFPGNPVSTTMCLYRYFIPWLKICLGMKQTEVYAILDKDVHFEHPLQYFMQVRIQNREGTLYALPDEGNGSGDFMNLSGTDAFMELPKERNNFMKGECYRVWPYKAY